MKKSIIVVCSLLFFISAQAQTTVQGYVFKDKNQNGKKEQNEGNGAVPFFFCNQL